MVEGSGGLGLLIECLFPGRALEASRTSILQPIPSLKIMHQDERGYLIVPHEVATGADCDGCIIVEERGDMADVKCNSCGAVIDTVPSTTPAITAVHAWIRPQKRPKTLS